MVFAGNANPTLAQKIAESLDSRMGNATVGQFSDGEIAVEINENVRGKDVFILQSTCAPTNDNLMELILMVDALRRASATRITAVLPYFGYERGLLSVQIGLLLVVLFMLVRYKVFGSTRTSGLADI